MATGTQAVMAAATLLLLSWSPVCAALLTVPDQFPTIQSAIAAAAGGDSIRIRAGTYLEVLNLSGKDLVLFGESGAEATIITTNSSSRIFDIGAGVSSGTVLSDLTFHEGFATEGGGIRLLDGASPVIRRCRFTSNRTMRDGGLSYGGALFAGGGSRLQVEDCTFSDNSAEMSFQHLQTYGLGGAIYAGAGTLILVRRSIFQGNSAGGFEGGPGGAIFIHEMGNVGIEDCSFYENLAGYGGGVCAAGNVTIRRCLFTGNTAQGGSGVSCFGSVSLIEESVFFDNNAWLWDGTIYARGPVQVRHNTVAFNTTSGGGVGGILLTSNAVLVENNIVTDNDGIGLQYDAASAPGAIACNDIWMNSGGNYGGSDLTGVDGNISLDPRFCDAAARELTIRDDSPCAPEAGSCGLIGALGVNCTVLAVSEHDLENTPPRAVHLLPPRPNPAALPVRIVFEVPAPTSIQIGIYAASGRRMATLADGVFAAGRHELSWPAGARGRDLELAAGVYFIALDAGSGRETERFILIQ